jgi:hypothetical protein
MRGKLELMLGVAIAAAAAASSAAPTKSAKAGETPPATKTLVADCAVHRFETTIQLVGPDGQPKQSKVRMCGTPGQTDQDWIGTLKDAVAKTTASTTMPQAAKEQIIAAVNAEIARLSVPRLSLPPGADISKLPRSAENTAPEVPLSRDYGALPPLPTTTVEPPHVLAGGGAVAPVPRLTLRCALAGDEDRPSACDSIDKDTVLVLRADDAYPRGVQLRFVRHGDDRAELDLPALKQGQTANLRLPPSVCSGVVRSRVEIQALGANAPSGTAAGTIGEYDLRC